MLVVREKARDLKMIIFWLLSFLGVCSKKGSYDLGLIIDGSGNYYFLAIVLFRCL